MRPLLALLEEAVARGAQTPGTSSTRCGSADLLLSPLGGSDTVGLRRLRRVLRQEELAAGGGRSSDELLSELRPGARGGAAAASAAPRGRWPRRRRRWPPASEAARWARVGGGPRRHVGVGPLGDLAGRGCRRRVAEAGTGRRPGGERADRDLDAVLALFDAAGLVRRPVADCRSRHVPRARPRPGRPGRHAARAAARPGPGVAADTPDRGRPGVAPRRGGRRAGGGLAGPAAARLDPRLRGPRQRRQPSGRWASGRRRPPCATTRPGSSTSP